jgi:hypothetical protein
LSFLMSSSHLLFGLTSGLLNIGFHWYTFLPFSGYSLHSINVRISRNEKKGVCYTIGQQPLVGQGLLVIEATLSHSDTPHPVELL